MTIFLIKAAQLVLALVILVTLHEFGHYFFARIFGIRVEKFYLFFNPWFSLLTYDPRKGTLNLLSRNASGDGNASKALATFRVGRPHPAAPGDKSSWRDTIYGLGWLPLGGYCSIAGMVDETKSAADLAAEPQDWEFRSKAAYKRLLVMVGGVLFNFLLAIAIYAGVAIHWGEKYIPFASMTEGMDFAPELREAGFRNGDILTTIDGQEIQAQNPGTLWNLVQPGTRVGVVRNGADTVVVIPDALVKSLMSKGKDYAPMTLRVPVYVLNAVPGEPAAKAGLVTHDHITGVDGTPTPSFGEFTEALRAHAGGEVTLDVERGDSTFRVPVQVSEGGRIGIQLIAPQDIFDTRVISYNILTAVPRGIELGCTQMATYVSSMKMLFTREGAQSIGGFGTLGQLFPDQWNWYTFWNLTAFLSIILAFMNILPIPGLDGGHTLFLLVEIVTRRRPSDRFLEIANMIGFGFLLLLLIYANGNDIFRFFIK